jgi:hypothetical protein
MQHQHIVPPKNSGPGSATPRCRGHLATLAAMRRTLWGRPRWQWVLEVMLVAIVTVVLLLLNRPASPIIAGGFVVVRVVVWTVQVAVWFQKKGAMDGPRDDRVMPPR